MKNRWDIPESKTPKSVLYRCAIDKFVGHALTDIEFETLELLMNDFSIEKFSESVKFAEEHPKLKEAQDALEMCKMEVMTND